MEKNLEEKYSVVLVAILKGEDQFVEEWVSYHRILGVDHFYLYDNESSLPLQKILNAHKDYVTVIPWLEDKISNRQSLAYTHFITTYGDKTTWAGFIDGDEFVVTKRHPNLKSFLLSHDLVDSVALNDFIFGNNGYYEVPKNLIIESLTRRSVEPSQHLKCFSKTASIKSVASPHYQLLNPGAKRVDSIGNTLPTYPEQDIPMAFNKDNKESREVACIYHYKARSFTTWMNRTSRGRATCFKDELKNHWTFENEACFKKYHDFILKETHQVEDTYMLRFVPEIKLYLKKIRENI